MKNHLAILAIALATFIASATDFPEATAFNTDNQSFTFTAPNTNSVVGTNTIEGNLYHTWYFVCTSNLNGALIATQVSPDTTNWIAFNTNSMAATTTPIATFTNFVSKQKFYRIVITGTNFQGTITYLGGR